MDIEEQVIAEAKALLGYLYDDVENVFLPTEEFLKVDAESEDFPDNLKEKMSPIEKEWYDLLDDFEDLLDDFISKYEQSS